MKEEKYILVFLPVESFHGLFFFPEFYNKRRLIL